MHAAGHWLSYEQSTVLAKLHWASYAPPDHRAGADYSQAAAARRQGSALPQPITVAKRSSAGNFMGNSVQKHACGCQTQSLDVLWLYVTLSPNDCAGFHLAQAAMHRCQGCFL